ncbi:hypothetical protein [Metabacillus fastidiosus]|uniref:hypothetical protein n=1 Tax=Metabacillus fastidiosus TaxID=1458 RepID=UPI003D26F3D9
MNKKPKKDQPIEGSEEALRAENERLRIENAYLKVTCLNSGKGKLKGLSTVQYRVQSSVTA